MKKFILFLLLTLIVLPVNAQDLKVIFTSDSKALVDEKMTVDIETMANQDATIWNAFLEKTVKYKWYKNEQLLKNEKSNSITFKESDIDTEFYVEVICDDLIIKSEKFLVKTETKLEEPTDKNEPTDEITNENNNETVNNNENTPIINKDSEDSNNNITIISACIITALVVGTITYLITKKKK